MARNTPIPSSLVLVEKIVRAKVKLEEAQVKHKGGCVTEDPESFAPCNCGASYVNQALTRAIRELDLKEFQ
jgi:hypothetical protein